MGWRLLSVPPAIAAVVALLLAPGCLRGSKSDPCAILEDCLCGELVGNARAECMEGDNRLGLVLGGRFAELGLDACQVVVSQQGAACPSGDLEARPLTPDPTRECVHDGDCEQVDCDCGGTAAMSVPVRGCVAGVCLDPVAECDRRCLAARVVRGDPCDMLRSCRCAPLAGDPSRDADGDGRADIEACQERFSLGDPAACMDAARRESTAGLDPLPSADCPDADGFVDDLQPAEDS